MRARAAACLRAPNAVVRDRSSRNVSSVLFVTARCCGQRPQRKDFDVVVVLDAAGLVEHAREAFVRVTTVRLLACGQEGDGAPDFGTVAFAGGDQRQGGPGAGHDLAVSARYVVTARAAF